MAELMDYCACKLSASGGLPRRNGKVAALFRVNGNFTGGKIRFSASPAFVHASTADFH
jgi:hypothetical protein